jgi:hypothetical protein
LAEARNRAINQIRLKVLERFVAQPKTIHYSGTEIFDDYIGGSDQAMKNFVSTLILEIDRQRSLAGILSEEGGAHQMFVELWIGAQLPRQISRFGDFDLDDVGAKLRELVTAKRAREHIGQIQNADAFEKFHSAKLKTLLKSSFMLGQAQHEWRMLRSP